MRRAKAKEFSGEALRARREELGMTQGEVADGLKALSKRLFGKTQPGSVSGWERGAKPSADHPLALAIVLRCDVLALYREAAD